MQKKVCEFVPYVDFKDVTPEVLTREKKENPLYEKAFLSREEVSDSEYCRNTTTWD